MSAIQLGSVYLTLTQNGYVSGSETPDYNWSINGCIDTVFFLTYRSSFIGFNGENFTIHFGPVAFSNRGGYWFLNNGSNKFLTSNGYDVAIATIQRIDQADVIPSSHHQLV